MLSMGVVLVPIPEILEELVALQQAILSLEALEPVLGLETNIPHVTMLQGRSERELLSAEELAVIAQEFCHLIPSCTLTIAGFEYVPNGWYFLEVQEKSELRLLQTSVLRVCAERLRVTEEDLKKDLSPYSSAQREHFRKYGYRYLGTEYRPHITLGRTEHFGPSKQGLEISRILEPNWVGRSIPIEEVALVALGAHGAYRERMLTLSV